MKVPVIVGAALAAVLCSTAAAQQSGMEGLTALSEAIRSNDAWQAEYTQEYIGAGMSAGEEVSGVVMIAWPDRAVFRSGDPVTQMMGLEHRTVRLVDLEVASCDQHLLDEREWARVPLAAVLDPGGAIEQFAVFEFGEDGFSLVPREPGGVDRVEVTLGEKRMPSQVVIVDPQGATNRLVFTAWTPAEGPVGESWLPEPPPGLECIVN